MVPLRVLSYVRVQFRVLNSAAVCLYHSRRCDELCRVVSDTYLELNGDGCDGRVAAAVPCRVDN